MIGGLDYTMDVKIYLIISLLIIAIFSIVLTIFLKKYHNLKNENIILLESIKEIDKIVPTMKMDERL